MHNYKYRHFAFAAAGLLLLATAALWSFNTISDLFGGPHA